MDNKAVGDRIKSVRKNLGLTTEKFAALFNPPASKGTISKWENGHYLPNNERLKKIADLGNMSVDELLYGESLEEENLYQYLVSIVHLYFQTNDKVLKEKYDMDKQKIDSILQKSLNFISDRTKEVTFEEEGKNIFPFDHYTEDFPEKHPYFIHRDIETSSLINNIEKFIFAETSSENKTLTVCDIAGIAVYNVEREIEDYIKYLDKNDMSYDKEIIEEILSEINSLSVSLKNIEKKIKSI